MTLAPKKRQIAKIIFMKKNYIIFIFILAFKFAYTQNQLQPIDVVDQTIKLGGLGGEENLYVGFAEGDQIVFNFKEVDGKELKSIDVSEYPSTPKYSEFKTSEITNKVLNVNRRGIYQFHFSNSAIGGRICKIHIQRIPAGEGTKLFNTNVVWKDIFDTTYTEEEERYVVKSDTSISNTNNVVTVHSQTNGQGNLNTVSFTLPENTAQWSFYIGVDESKTQSYANAASDFTKTAASAAVKIPGYGVTAALALYGISYFTQITAGNAVDYYIVNSEEASTFSSGGNINSAYKYGSQVVNAFSQMKTPLQGQYYVCLKNHNMFEPIDVTINVSAIVIKKQWATRQVKRMHIDKKNLPFIAN